MPYCNQCGAQNPENSAFCCSCGQPLNAQPQQASYSQPVYPQPTPTAEDPYAHSAPIPQDPYGYSVPAFQNPSTPAKLPTAANVLSIVSMVCGIFSCVTLFMGFLFSIAALITFGISRKKTPAGMSNGKATAGLITGIIGIVLSVIWIIIYVALIAELMDNSYHYSYDYYDYYY